jgi:hypothetical protein
MKEKNFNLDFNLFTTHLIKEAKIVPLTDLTKQPPVFRGCFIRYLFIEETKSFFSKHSPDVLSMPEKGIIGSIQKLVTEETAGEEVELLGRVTSFDFGACHKKLEAISKSDREILYFYHAMTEYAGTDFILKHLTSGGNLLMLNYSFVLMLCQKFTFEEGLMTKDLLPILQLCPLENFIKLKSETSLFTSSDFTKVYNSLDELYKKEVNTAMCFKMKDISEHPLFKIGIAKKIIDGIYPEGAYTGK